MAGRAGPVIQLGVELWGNAMAEGLPGWIPEAERSFKEVLYRFLEEVHCTKAALYLERPAGTFVLAARYGFGRGDAPPDELAVDDPIVVAAYRCGDNPLVVNEPSDEPSLEMRLLAAGCHRLLLVPLLIGDRLIGLVDAREKGGQQPFDDTDGHAAKVIAGELAGVASGLGLVQEKVAPEPEPLPDELHEPLPPVLELDEPVLLDLPAIADLAGVAAETVVRDGVYAAALTVAVDETATTLLFGSADSDEGEAEAVRAHQTEALLASGLVVPRQSSWTFEWRRVSRSGDEPRPSLIVSTVPLTSGPWSLVASVVGAEGSSDPSAVLYRLRRELAAVHQMSKLRYTRRSLAQRLLQPGEKRFPDLLFHSVAVSRLCWRMAHALDLDHEQAELAAIAGLLHDVGMRELDYDRLYRLADPLPEHHGVYRKHPVVGEKIVRGVGMEPVADAIRHHHERWDGKGYPDRWAGDEIPWMGRLVHVAEVFDVLTSPSSYRAPVPVDRALSTIESAAGRQFDPEMVDLLVRVVS